MLFEFVYFLYLSLFKVFYFFFDSALLCFIFTIQYEISLWCLFDMFYDKFYGEVWSFVMLL